MRPLLPGDLLFISELVDFMTSKDISASERLKCSLDIFFLSGILLRNSLVPAGGVIVWWRVFHKTLLQIWKCP